MGFAYPIDSKVVTNPNGTIDYDRASSSSQLRGLIKSMITNGVNLTESTNLQVMVDEETMNLTVKPGYVIIEGALKHFEEDVKVTIGAADTTNPRIDTVVARLNLNEDVRDIVIDVLQGTPSAEPVAPELSQETSTYYELGLADILVEPESTQISQASVTDTRLLNSRCGLVSAIGEIDTETLFNQLTTDFNNWFDGIRNKLGDDVAGSLQEQINAHTENSIIHTTEEEKTTWNNYPETLKTLVESDVARAFDTSYLKKESYLLDNINIKSNTLFELSTAGVDKADSTYQYVVLVYKDLGNNQIRKLCTNGSNAYAICNLSNSKLKTFNMYNSNIIMYNGEPHFAYRATSNSNYTYEIYKIHNDDLVKVSNTLTQAPSEIFIHNNELCYFYYGSGDTVYFYKVNEDGTDKIFSTLGITDVDNLNNYSHVDSLDGELHFMGITTYYASRSYTNWHYILSDGVWIRYNTPSTYDGCHKGTFIYDNQLYMFGILTVDKNCYANVYKWDKETKKWVTVCSMPNSCAAGYPFIFEDTLYLMCRANTSRNNIEGVYRFTGSGWVDVMCATSTVSHAYQYQLVEPYTTIDGTVYIQTGRVIYKVNLKESNPFVSTFNIHSNKGSKSIVIRDLGTNNYVQDNQVITGHYNNYKNSTAGATSGTSGQAFCIGNGTSSSRSNALRVSYGGNIYAQSSTVGTGADYSEYFEWADGNEENEDRVGYFVTFDDKQKIRKANATDNYILGIVSGLPCIIGNGDEDWRGKYILDEFGRFIEETFEYEETVINSETGEEETVTRIGTKYKENPDYNPNQTYIERAKRKEWNAIGMIGVLSVYDDGTCQENGYCTVSDGGIATACEYSNVKAYRVLERVTDNIIKVLFK